MLFLLLCVYSFSKEITAKDVMAIDIPPIKKRSVLNGPEKETLDKIIECIIKERKSQLEQDKRGLNPCCSYNKYDFGLEFSMLIIDGSLVRKNLIRRGFKIKETPFVKEIGGTEFVTPWIVSVCAK